ncbi:MAG: Hsp20/alpha crystallin family protein, partial [Synergistales bacterium]|nr:Hsp20/alpha crystallin family protein [Synergistales bacterium]
MLMKLDRLQQDISTMIDDFTRHMTVRPPEGAPAVNVDLYRDDGYLVAEMELPGIDPQNVELKVYEDRMTIKAERIQEKKVESKDCYCSERYFGKIARVISLPVLI